MSPKSAKPRSVVQTVKDVLFEDRRLLAGAIIFAIAAVVMYIIVRYFGMGVVA
jgi:hypothetical protein